MNSTTDIAGWTPEPEGRGTIGLLWSCFATIFLCTWNAIHPNLPGMDESKFRIIGRRMLYVLFCLLAPEWFAFSALDNLGSVMQVRKEVKAANLNWSLKQCFFLMMGGYVVQNDTPTGAKQYRVHPKKLMILFQSKALPWPSLSDAEIDDHSKADWIIKGLALFQILWFITQLIGRWAQGLAVTTLELFTMGIVLCAIVTYIASWEKPFEVQVPVVLHAKDSVLKEDLIDRVNIDNSFAPYEDTWVLLGTVALCLAFGALHVGAWNFHLPSMTEQLLWRISSIACIVLPFLFAFVSVLVDYSCDSLEISDNSMKTSDLIILLVVAFLYFLFRLYMFVEMFVALRAAPASVYQTPQWSQYFPSFG